MFNHRVDSKVDTEFITYGFGARIRYLSAPSLDRKEIKLARYRRASILHLEFSELSSYVIYARYIIFHTAPAPIWIRRRTVE